MLTFAIASFFALALLGSMFAMAATVREHGDAVIAALEFGIAKDGGGNAAAPSEPAPYRARSAAPRMANPHRPIRRAHWRAAA